MEYRYLPHGGEKISVIGMGTGSVGEASENNVTETVECALENGINYFDMAGGYAGTGHGAGTATRCPFRVDQMKRMEKIAGYFGR